MDGLRIGQRRGPFSLRLEPDVLSRYASVLRGTGVDSGSAAIALITQLWEAQEVGRTGCVPIALQEAAAGGVHGEHDLLLHRPVQRGEIFRVWVEGWGARPAGRNSAITLRYTAMDATGGVVAEQWWTTVWLGVECQQVGEPVPDHAFPESARDRSLGTVTFPIDKDMARRYAELSGDWSAHHFNLEAAQKSGFERPFLHGLCTLALCGEAVVQVAGAGLTRLAARFSAPAFLESELTVSIYDAGSLGVAFEASCDGAAVISHGRAVVGQGSPNQR